MTWISLISGKTICYEKLIDSSIPPSLDFPSEGGGGERGYNCFVCSRSTKAGEPFVVVERMWWRNGFVNQESLDAVASLQVCMDCTYRTAEREVEWDYLPKVVDTELFGFYNYARDLASALTRQLSDTRIDESSLRKVISPEKPPLNLLLDPLLVSGGLYRSVPLKLICPDQCYNCYGSIDEKSSHMWIQLAINVPTPTGLAVYNPFTVAMYCDPCLRALFPIEGDHMSLYI